MQNKLSQLNFLNKFGENSEIYNQTNIGSIAFQEKSNNIQLAMPNSLQSKPTKFDFGPSCFASERLKASTNLNYILKKRALKKAEEDFPLLLQTTDSCYQSMLENGQSNEKSYEHQELKNLITKLREDRVLPSAFLKLSKMILTKKRENLKKAFKETDSKIFLVKSLSPESICKTEEGKESTVLFKKATLLNKEFKIKFDANFNPKENPESRTTRLLRTNLPIE